MNNRKTLIVGMALVGVMSLAGAAMAFTPDSPVASAPIQTALQVERPLLVQDGEEVAPEDVAPSEEGVPQREGRRGGQGIIDRDAVHAAVADALGLTVEELEAARDEGQSIADLAEAAGITVEELEAVQQAVREELVNQAVADGVITAEEAEQILSGEGRQGRRGNGGRGFSGVIDREAMMADVADALGISDEQLAAAQEEGLKLSELAEELGISPEEVEAAKDAAKEAAVNQAVADGLITAEEAEQILNGEGRQGRRGGPRGGNNNGFDGTPDGQIGLEGNNA